MAAATVEILIRAQENVSQAVNEVKQHFESLSQHAQTVFGRLTQFFRQNEEALNSLAKVGAVVAGTLTALAVSGARYSNQLREEALQIGTTVEKYSLYRAMLQDLEIRAEMLPMFIMRMQVAFQQAAAAVAEKGDRVNELTMALAVLGQTVQSQTNDPLEQFVLLLKEIAKIPDQAQQATILFELFGRKAYTLLPILREGAQEIDNLIQKYRELGVVVSDEAAKKIDSMTDAFGTLKAAAKALLSEGLADVAPTLEKIAEGINKAVAAIREFKEEHPTLSSFVSHLMLMVTALAMVAVLLAGVGHGVKWVGEGLKALGALKILDWVKNLAGGFGKLWDILKVFGSRLLAVVGAPLLTIGAIILGIGYAIRKIDEKTGKFSDWLAKLMLPKEMRHLVDEGARDRKEAEEWLRRQEEKRKQEEERKKQEKKKEEADFLGQFRKLLEDFFGAGKDKDKKAPERKTEKDEWALWREQMLQSQQNIEKRWNDYIDRLEKQRQEWLEFQKKQAEEMKKKYDELVEKQKETYERIARAEEEMRQRMAEAYASAARLAANLAARAGVYHVRFGAFGYFAIPVVQEAHPLAYTPSREEMTLSYTAYIYYYAQQIWLSIQNIIVLLQQEVGHLSLIAQAVAKSAGGATLNVNVPFGYDQIRAAIADAVNEALGKQLAHELVRNA
jgi:ABC-type transporter Mla subunit MlaD